MATNVKDKIREIKLQQTNRAQLSVITDVADAIKFNEITYLFYEYEPECEQYYRTRALKAYGAAVEAMQMFLYHILMQELSIKNISAAEAELYLPDRILKIPVSINTNVPLDDVRQKRIINTIGSFDEFTWDAILSLNFAENPVYLFFERLSYDLKYLRERLEASGIDWKVVPLNRALLVEKCQLQEVVDIHNLIFLKHKIDECLCKW